MILLQGKINLLPSPSNDFSSDTFRLQKGYHCNSLDLRRYILSVDVNFFETCPFFPSTPDKSIDHGDILPQESSCFPVAPNPNTLYTFQRRLRPQSTTVDSTPP